MESSSSSTGSITASQDYFHGWLPREDLAFFLVDPGDFLVRVSQPDPGDPPAEIVSVKEKETIMVDEVERLQLDVQPRNVVIHRDKGKYLVDDKYSFDSVPELINHYMNTKETIVPGVSR
jgi:hypothetical protein